MATGGFYSVKVPAFEFTMPTTVMENLRGNFNQPAVYVKIPLETYLANPDSHQLLLSVENIKIIFSCDRIATLATALQDRGSTPDTEPLSDFENGFVSDSGQMSPSILHQGP